MKKYFAEFLGTFILVLVSCGVAVYSGGNLVATALAFGITLTLLVYTIGSVSGAHVNPAVSLAFLINRKLSAKDFGFYVLAQILGATVAGALLWSFGKIVNPDAVVNVGANFFGNGNINAEQMWQQILIGFMVEVLMTFVFIFTIIGVTRKSGDKVVAGIIIGLALTVVHLFAINITGTSVNPARSLGVAFFAGTQALKEIWLFIVAPLVGGALASLVAGVIYPAEEIIGEDKKGK